MANNNVVFCTLTLLLRIMHLLPSAALQKKAQHMHIINYNVKNLPFFWFVTNSHGLSSINIQFLESEVVKPIFCHVMKQFVDCRLCKLNFKFFQYFPTQSFCCNSRMSKRRILKIVVLETSKQSARLSWVYSPVPYAPFQSALLEISPSFEIHIHFSQNLFLFLFGGNHR
jgi:hypothetical protein